MNEQTNENELKTLVQFAPDIEVHSLGNYIDRGIPEPKWLVEGVVPKGLTLIIGSSGIGKTWLVLHLAICVATGQNFLGRRIGDSGKVLIIDEENNMSELYRRFKTMLPSLSAEQKAAVREAIMIPNHFGFKFETSFGEMTNEAVMDGFIKKQCIKLLIIDPMRAVMDGDENSSEATQAFLGILKRLAQKHDMSTVLLHHPPKVKRKGKTEGRGSGHFRGTADCILIIDSDGDSTASELPIRIELDKLRAGPAQRPMHAVIAFSEDSKITEVRFNGAAPQEAPSKADEIDACVLEYLKGKDEVSKANIVKEMEPRGYSVSSVEKRLNRLLETGKLTKSGRGKYTLPIQTTLS